MESIKTKKSNLELLRIINMLLIIAHHLAVHTPFTFENVHIKYIVYFLSLGGKIGVNSFILLSKPYFSKCFLTASIDIFAPPN